jgi:inosine-uridine nucleoside N-ribohydrolase
MRFENGEAALAQKVIIDADPGIGDAVALALALHDPQIDVLAITGTAGTVTGRLATRNIQAVIEDLDPPKWPRLGCSELPGSRPDFNSLNGPYGLGDREFGIVELHHTHDSVKVMIDVVRSEPNEITLLALGPLTNIAMACERAPEFLSRLKGLVCLGGAVSCGGDITPAAEFNIYANPSAARTVLLSPATKTLVPLDASNSIVLTFEKFNRVINGRQTPLAKFLASVLPFAFRAHHEHLGLEGLRLHELAALASIARPELVRTEAMALDVETRGELTRGMTVFDRRGIDQWQANIDVVRHVDAEGVIDYFSQLLGGLA